MVLVTATAMGMFLGRGIVQFFFFQAEDGIRDIGVTGVQTCALPISARRAMHSRRDCSVWQRTMRSAAGRSSSELSQRSEERRVGKECRSRWSADDESKKRDGEAVWNHGLEIDEGWPAVILFCSPTC